MSASAINFSRTLLKTTSPARKGGSSKWFRALTVSTLLAGSAIYAYQQRQNSDDHHKKNKYNNTEKFLFAGAAGLNVASKNEKTFNDYQKVYNDIAQKLIDDDDYDDGSYGPVLVRLAWHSAGTFKSDDNTGGPYGGTMRFEKEAKDPGNNGLANGRDFLEEFKTKYPWLSYGDLWTLGGVVSVQELNGPKVKWRPGRKDVTESKVPPNGRLPDGSKGADHVRDVFVKRMNFSDRETVAIIGAHVLGRCHKQNSGFDGPWQENPTYFSNAFFTKLLENWHVRPDWDGNKQYEDDNSKSLMMLPTDMALKEDSAFLKYVKLYASDEKVFFDDFSKAFQKLLELGIEFPSTTPEFTFKTLDEQN